MKELKVDLSLEGNQLKRFAFEKLSVDPEGGELYQGRAWFNTTSRLLKYYNGTDIIPLNSGYMQSFFWSGLFSDLVEIQNVIDNKMDYYLPENYMFVGGANDIPVAFTAEEIRAFLSVLTQTEIETLISAIDLSTKADLVDGKVPASQLPSYVDDVIEVANLTSLPAEGETSKIYITLDNNYTYRWSGSTYINISASLETLATEGARINSATAKTTPIDADMIGLMDSADSNILKKLSWANIKAILKSYVF